MGGAFSAIADDATAALANPAGLGLISSIEVVVSGKKVDETLALATARSVATGSLQAPYPPVTTSSVGLDASSTGVEFAGVVVPISRRFVAALTYAENLRFEGDAGAGGYQYLELRDNRSPSGTTRRDYLYEYREFGSAKLSNRLLAASLAFRVTESLRIGGGVTLNRATFRPRRRRGRPAPGREPILPVADVPGDLFDVTMGVQGVSGTQVGFVAGVHADLIADGKLTFGADYRWTPAAEGTLVIGGDVPAALAAPDVARVPVPRPERRVRRPRGAPDARPHDRGGGPVGEVRRDLRPRRCPSCRTPDSWVRPAFPVDGVLADLSPAPNVFVPRLGFEYVAGTEDVRARVPRRLPPRARARGHREPRGARRLRPAVPDHGPAVLRRRRRRVRRRAARTTGSRAASA